MEIAYRNKPHRRRRATETAPSAFAKAAADGTANGSGDWFSHGMFISSRLKPQPILSVTAREPIGRLGPQLAIPSSQRLRRLGKTNPSLASK